MDAPGCQPRLWKIPIQCGLHEKDGLLETTRTVPSRVPCDSFGVNEKVAHSRHFLVCGRILSTLDISIRKTILRPLDLARHRRIEDDRQGPKANGFPMNPEDKRRSYAAKSLDPSFLKPSEGRRTAGILEPIGELAFGAEEHCLKERVSSPTKFSPHRKPTVISRNNRRRKPCNIGRRTAL